MTTKFVIITTERTGSNYLCRLLDNHPQITCHLELYHPRRIFWSSKTEEGDEVIKARNDDPIGFLEKIYQYPVPPETKSIGFKLFIQHNKQALNNLLQDPGVKKIVLRRDNMLAKYSSKIIANQTKTWSTKKSDDEQAKIEWDEQGFLDYQAKMDKFYSNVFDTLREQGDTWFDLEYLQVRNEAVIEKMMTFVGVTYQNVSDDVKIQKQNTSNILERFQKPDVVRAYLQEHNLSHWIEEQT